MMLLDQFTFRSSRWRMKQRGKECNIWTADATRSDYYPMCVLSQRNKVATHMWKYKTINLNFSSFLILYVLPQHHYFVFASVMVNHCNQDAAEILKPGFTPARHQLDWTNPINDKVMIMMTRQLGSTGFSLVTRPRWWQPACPLSCSTAPLYRPDLDSLSRNNWRLVGKKKYPSQ